MPSRSAVASAITAKLVLKNQGNLQFSDLAQAVQSFATQSDKDALAAAMQKDDGRAFYQTIRRVVIAKIRSDASQSASIFLANNSLDLDELDEVFGPF